MRKLTISILFLAASAFAGEWTGYISDAKCGAAHNDGSAKSVACVKGCVKGGQKPVFVVDGKVIKIANPDKVGEDLLGGKVTIKGELKGEDLTIASIAAAK
jgi:hypothetical protein